MNPELPYTTERMENWEAAKERLSQFCEGEGVWIFRGQSSSRWPLATGLERMKETGGRSRSKAEDLLLGYFNRKLHHYLSGAQLPTHTLEIMALMQHHGAPTRLLDFTFSPYVASFFAADGAATSDCDGTDDGSCAVWAINGDWLDAEAQRVLAKAYRWEKIDLSDDKSVSQLLIGRKVPMVLYIDIYKMNERIISQQGVFLCPGDPDKKIAENLSAYNQAELPDNVYKILIPKRCRAGILADLNRMNINEATLYPGLDGFARSTKNALFVSNEKPEDTKHWRLC